MRILFLHPNFPAQFRHLATELAKDPGNQVMFGTMSPKGSISGVQKVLYEPSRKVHPRTHQYLRSQESAVLQGQAVFRLAQNLKLAGFYPDIVYGHAGCGATMFIKDVFPKAQLNCYFEWFYHAKDSDADFDPKDPFDADDSAKIRVKNSPILIDLYSCDRGLCPTQWQKQQFPKEFHAKLKVIHDGIDTEFFIPQPQAKLTLPAINLDLSHAEEIVTYVTRGMETYRGFPQFMSAVSILQQQRPNCHVVIVEEDRVVDGKNLSDSKTYKQLTLKTLNLDLSRIHFTGSLPDDLYLQILQASSAHIYLTRSFVLSWSMLQAMSTGCVVIGSSTSPVEEVIQDGKNGLLVDFFSPEQIARKVNDVLDNPQRYSYVRKQARETIVKKYDLAKLLPQHLGWLNQELKPPAKSKTLEFGAKSRLIA
ncbi:MAG: glycosyltransferase family 4 protein [Cyanobacteria bacterium P01_G01_bin.19]